MAKKILNIMLAGTSAGISNELVEFNAEGVGTIQNEELYTELLTLANFFPVEDEKAPEKVKESTLDTSDIVAKSPIKKRINQKGE